MMLLTIVLCFLCVVMISSIPKRTSIRELPTDFWEAYWQHEDDAARIRQDENQIKWQECQRIEEEALRRQRWEMETLFAWWDLFRSAHGVKFGAMYGMPLRFHPARAVLIDDKPFAHFEPNIPKPLPSPEQMWSLWLCVFVTKIPPDQARLLTKVVTE